MNQRLLLVLRKARGCSGAADVCAKDQAPFRFGRCLQYAPPAPFTAPYRYHMVACLVPGKLAYACKAGDIPCPLKVYIFCFAA